VQRSIANNMRLYPWYQAATSVAPWIPVFFLFFSQTVSLGEAIKLSAIYYFSVFALEVPSGYFSDRAGRRITLIIAAGFACLAYLTFLMADNFIVLAAAQCFLATGIAFQSGSDNSILYDSLVATGQQDQYARFEARGLQFGMTALACSCFLGGALGSIELWIPYIVAFAGALASLALSLSFVEPASADDTAAKPFIAQLASVIQRLKNPVLLWIFLFYVAGYALEHVPFEFFQPYISLLDTGRFSAFFNSQNAALVSGIVIGVSMFGGALGATVSIKVQDRVGVTSLLLGSIMIQCIIITGLALWLHPALLILVMFRNFAMAMARGPMLGAIAPRIASGERATYLSMQSLAGRLAFSSVLFALASSTTDDIPVDWLTLSVILRNCAVSGFIVFIVLALLARLVKNNIETPPSDDINA